MEETILNEVPKTSELNQKLLTMLEHFQKDLNALDAKQIFAAYFALLDDGSSCVTLDAEALIAKCEKKWKLPFSNDLKMIFEKIPLDMILEKFRAAILLRIRIQSNWHCCMN